MQLLRQSLTQAADAQCPINGIFGASCLPEMSLNPHADAWSCGITRIQEACHYHLQLNLQMLYS